jgi:hypothetical protein
LQPERRSLRWGAVVVLDDMSEDVLRTATDDRTSAGQQAANGASSGGAV